MIYPGLSVDDAISDLARISSAECKGTATQPFTKLWLSTTSATSYASDPYLSDTSVAVYWTGAPKLILGEITGSATARQTVITDTRNEWYWISHGPPTPNYLGVNGKTTAASSAATTGGTGLKAGDTTSAAAAATSTGGA